EGCLVHLAALPDALACVRAKLVERPLRARDADHRQVEGTAPCHRVERGEDLLVGEVAARTEEHQGVRAGRAHRTAPRPASASRAACTRCSGVKPNLVWSCFSGADAPKVFMPTMRPAGPT